MSAESSKSLKIRVRQFAADTIRAASKIEVTSASRSLIDQWIRSACSAGANFRASQRPRSTADMIAKLKIVEEEIDEAMYWMELLVVTDLAPKPMLKDLYAEANELMPITVSSIKSLRERPSGVKEVMATYGEERDTIFTS